MRTRVLIALCITATLAAALAGCAGAARRPAESPSRGSGRAHERSSSSSTNKPTRPGDVQRGLATFYGKPQHGGPTASGEKFDMHAMTAAHLTLRFNTRVRVTNEKNGKSVIVRINDRGPYGNRKRIIDVSEHAATKLDMIDAGVVPVRVEVLSVPPKKAKKAKKHKHRRRG